jgi:site-specific DNA-methyltransferase (adenine-specific)
VNQPTVSVTRGFWRCPTSSNDRDPDNHHPAAYPVELAEWMIRTFVPVGGTVLDPFVGSGSTAVAARVCGRGFIGCDIDGEYVAMAKARVRALPVEQQAAE